MKFFIMSIMLLSVRSAPINKDERKLRREGSESERDLQCTEPADGCNFGLWNPTTCDCDCIVPLCDSDSGHCDWGCGEFSSPWAGCSADCPWYPKPGTEHCKQGDVPFGVWSVYSTRDACCAAEFPDKPCQSPPTRPRSEYKFYPDQTAGGCANDGQEPSWMSVSGFIEDYLFIYPEDCCEKWFSKGADCALSRVAVADGENKYYPDLDLGTCFNDDKAPSFMLLPGFPENGYLFGSGEACCDFWFKKSDVTCPSSREAIDAGDTPALRNNQTNKKRKRDDEKKKDKANRKCKRKANANC